MDIFFETKSNMFDNIFTELVFPKHAPVSVFKNVEDLSIFEKYTRGLFDINLPIPFTGEVQVSYLDPSVHNDFKAKNFTKDAKTIVIKSAKTISEILLLSLIDEDGLCWVDYFKYLGDGKLLICLCEHENDFIRFNEPLFNSLIADGYRIESYSNKEIWFKKNNFIINIETFCYEPLMITINYYHEELNPLIEQEVRDEILKFLPGLSNWNCIPAMFNKKRFSLIANFDWGWISKDIKVDDCFNADYLTARALKFLSTQRRSIQYKLDKNDNPFDRLVFEVNKAEKNIFGESYYIDVEINREEDAKLNKTPNGFKDFKFQQIALLTKQSGDNLGDIILWKYNSTKEAIAIEYSIKKTSKELILNIAFEQ